MGKVEPLPQLAILIDGVHHRRPHGTSKAVPVPHKFPCPVPARHPLPCRNSQLCPSSVPPVFKTRHPPPAEFSPCPRRQSPGRISPESVCVLLPEDDAVTIPCNTACPSLPLLSHVTPPSLQTRKLRILIDEFLFRIPKAKFERLFIYLLDRVKTERQTDSLMTGSHRFSQGINRARQGNTDAPPTPNHHPRPRTKTHHALHCCSVP
jgi:hypothetical protein